MSAQAPAGRALPSAAFLACSWTWCIGMWIPVYLIHDFGVWGWVVFAIPNVIGAAAVGFVHRTPQAATAFRARGIEPMRWFSVVTILFHIGFLGWTFWERPPSFLPSQSAFFAPLLALAVGAAVSRLSWRALARLALLIITSMLALLALLMFVNFIGSLRDGSFPFDPQATLGLDIPRTEGVIEAPFALPFYAVGVAFGFLFCPHLDLTILRTRQENPGVGGDIAFLLGFGVFFLMMITLTAFYAAGILAGWFSEYLLLHFLIQATFTIGAHLHELRRDGWPKPIGPSTKTLPITFLILALACAALAPISDIAPTIFDKLPTRVAYDSFLWFYALPFPAIALFLLRKRTLNAPFWTSIALATPFMAAGAIWAIWWAVPVAVALPVAALLVSLKTPKNTVA